MSAYHSYDGVPAVADYHTLTEILREEWGYEYFVSLQHAVLWMTLRAAETSCAELTDSALHRS